MAAMTDHEKWVAALMLRRGYEPFEVSDALGHAMPARRRSPDGLITEDRAATISRMWRDGMPLADIARETGVSTRAVQSFAGRHRDMCPRRTRGGRRKDIDMGRVAEMVERGVPYWQIAEELGVSVYTIRNRLKEERRCADTQAIATGD